jgi:hypothetical protein
MLNPLQNSMEKKNLQKEENHSAGTINGKSSDVAKNQTSKKWFILAVGIGTLVVIGGLGTVGLIHSYGLNLPQGLQWLTSAIGTIGNTSHFWSLWTMAVGGTVAGGILITYSIYKICAFNRQDSKGLNLNFEEQFENPHFPLNNNEQTTSESKKSEEQKIEIIHNVIKDGNEVEIDFEAESTNVENFLDSQQIIPYKPTNGSSLPEQYYQTYNHEDLGKAPIGSYCLVPYKGPFQYMYIKKDNENKFLKIIVRASTQYPGLYRLVNYNKEKRTYHESTIPFRSAQLSAMIRHAYVPENGIRISSLTNLIRHTGLIVFTSGSKFEK